MNNKLLLFFLLGSLSFYAQVGIGTLTPDSSSALDITSNSAGFAMPRMTTVERTGIPNPVAGLQVFDTDTHSIWFYNGQQWRDLTPIKAFGKIQGNGNSIKIVGATSTRNSAGHYTISFNSAMPDSNYIILLTVLDFNNIGKDDPGITYLNQTVDGFDVNIQNNDDGGNDGTPTDRQFMFTVLNQE